jgi:hypothetical protein
VPVQKVLVANRPDLASAKETGQINAANNFLNNSF